MASLDGHAKIIEQNGPQIHTHAVFPHILISAKCENHNWIFREKSEKCETEKLDNISHKK